MAEEKEKKKKSKKGLIIALLLIIVIIAVAVAVVVLINGSSDEESKEEAGETEINWQETYIAILEDEENFEDMEDTEIQLLDLDEDEIPELVVYGTISDDFITKIYSLIENEAEEAEYSLDNEFTLGYVYDAKNSKYKWMAVSEQEESTKLYTLNEESGELEYFAVGAKEDVVIIEDNYSEKVSFISNGDSSEIEKALEDAENEYVKTKDLLTEEVLAKVETAELVKSVKTSSGKAIVSSAGSYKDQYDYYTYPVINIDSADVDEINSELDSKWIHYVGSDVGFEWVGEDVYLDYEYFVNGKILSVIIYYGGNDSLWTDVYNINLETLEKISGEDILEEYGFDKSEVISNSNEIALECMESELEADKTALGDNWVFDSLLEEWQEELEENIEELKIYINSDGDVCLLTDFRHPGGQESCWQSIIVNITDNYSAELIYLNESELYITLIKPEEYVSRYASTSTTTTTSSSTSSTVSNVTFASSTTVVPEGTYSRDDTGTLVITNSSAGQFDFDLECIHMGSEYPYMGVLSGTAKSTSDGRFAYTERISNGDYFDYNVFFTVSGDSITIEDEYKTSGSPYCGFNVTFDGMFTK